MSVQDGNVSDSSVAFSDDEIDIFSSLVGSTSKTTGIEKSDDDNDEELSQLIHSSISKHRVKGGAKVLKQATGKIVKGQVGGGSFQNMGLHPALLRSLTLQGFRVPTPIQRLAIPSLLSNPPQDLVGMARTGSGKSLAYMIPLVQRLGGIHATTFGARALILVPTRELALQVLKVGKELARGWHSASSDHAGDRTGREVDSKHSQALKWGLVVGGEGLDEQFDMISGNPDVIIATPGRLLHLLVEMNLDLKSVNYVVFDEADRLFELGFELSLTEILSRLPTSRQTLLFSATLPKSLVEFAKAGLKDPKLVRLDAESKISPDLKMAFFSVKNVEKDACLVSLLRDIIQVPLGFPAEEPPSHKGKSKGRTHPHVTAPHQTLIFAATKHHVEYLTTLLTTSGYAVSHIYGSLDQHARTSQMDQFRRGRTSILVVTDVAARGIDIPVLENVINYDFPQGARVFVHRVGRTARAGRQGWAWSLVTYQELPYLLDLQLFLGRPLQTSVTGDGDQAYTESLVLGSFEREKIDQDVEYVRSLEAENSSLPTLRQVMARGHSMYERSKGKASPASYTRAKEMMKDPKWALSGTHSGIHPVLLRGADSSKLIAGEDKRKALLKAVNSFKPAETVLELGSKGKTDNAVLMSKRRKALGKSIARQAQPSVIENQERSGDEKVGGVQTDIEMADEEDIAATFSATKMRKYEDSEFYMSHYQKDASTEKGYSLKDGATFVEQAAGATFDLTGDEGKAERKRRSLQWDKRKKKFVQGGGAGADNVKLVKTENGTRLPATYRSGRFDEWKSKTRTTLPRVGEAENEGSSRRGLGSQRFKHQKIVVAKPLDKFAKDYDRKVRQMKKRHNEAGEDEQPSRKGRGATRLGTKTIGRVKSELKTNDQIRKNRGLLEKKRAKNARPAKKGGKRGRR